MIRKILQQEKISFVQEYSFDNCVNPKTGYKLRFDFYLPDYNICIEYDGEQHYKEIPFFKDSVKSGQYRDTIKTQFCKNNNIKLVRIPYTDKSKISANYLLERILCK